MAVNQRMCLKLSLPVLIISAHAGAGPVPLVTDRPGGPGHEVFIHITTRRDKS